MKRIWHKSFCLSAKNNDIYYSGRCVKGLQARNLICFIAKSNGMEGEEKELERSLNVGDNINCRNRIAPGVIEVTCFEIWEKHTLFSLSLSNLSLINYLIHLLDKRSFIFQRNEVCFTYKLVMFHITAVSNIIFLKCITLYNVLVYNLITHFFNQPQYMHIVLFKCERSKRFISNTS